MQCAPAQVRHKVLQPCAVLHKHAMHACLAIHETSSELLSYVNSLQTMECVRGCLPGVII